MTSIMAMSCHLRILCQLYTSRMCTSYHSKVKVGSAPAKAAALCVNFNIDGTPITSRTHIQHTHPSHSKASRLLTLSLSLGVPVPLTTEWM